MLTILLIHLVGLASPGPDFFYVIRQSVSHSTRAGILASVGIAMGIIFWAAFAIFGLAWLKHSVGNVLQYAIMLLGGSYLAYLGSKMVRVKDNAKFSEEKTNLLELNAITEIRKGLMINIMNAKAGVYFTSVISAFLDQFTETYQLFELLFLFVFSTFIYFYLVALLFSRKPIRKIYAKNSRYIDNVAGVIFIGFGLKLIYEGITHLAVIL